GSIGEDAIHVHRARHHQDVERTVVGEGCGGLDQEAVVASDGLAARRDGDDLEGLSPFTRRLREHLHRGDYFAGQESVEDHHADAQGLGREGDRAHEGQHTAEKSTHPNLSIRPFPRFCEEGGYPSLFYARDRSYRKIHLRDFRYTICAWE